MTVTQESSKSPLYQGDGSVSAFAFNFKVLSDDHLLVYTYNVDTEVTTLLVKNIDYTVNLASGGSSGGVVNTTTPPANNMKLRIFRNTPKDQQMNIANQGNFYPSVLNGSADKAILLIQEIVDLLERAVIVDPMSPKSAQDLVTEALDTANEALGIASTTFTVVSNYVNKTLAQWFASQGNWDNPIVWTTTLEIGQQMVNTPFRFRQGLFFYGGATYALNNIEHVTLDQSQGFTRILLNEPVLFAAEGILVVLNTDVPLQATWSGNISSGDDTITTPFTETQLNAGGFIVVGQEIFNLADCTIDGADVTIPIEAVADSEVVLVLLSQ